MNYTIREGSDTDIPVILGLLYDLGRPKPKEDSDVDLFRSRLRGYIADPDKAVFVAEIDDVKIVGMVSILFLPRLNQRGLEMYIPELVVLEGYRRMGIGEQLVDRCACLAEKKGCHRMRLESGNHRSEAHDFYMNLGFDQSAMSFEKATSPSK